MTNPKSPSPETHEEVAIAIGAILDKHTSWEECGEGFREICRECAAAVCPSPKNHITGDDLPTLHSETTPDGGVIRLSKWPEGYVLWYHGKIVFRSWSETADFAAQNPAHFDNRSIEAFAYGMRIKMAAKRIEGRGGWHDKEKCSNEYLSQLLREHVEKGDPVDVANFCMMLDQRHERILPSPETRPVSEITGSAISETPPQSRARGNDE